MDIITKLIDMFKSDADAELDAKMEQESALRRQRNEERMEAIKREMGEKWILHPSHKKSRLDEPRPV